MIWHNSTSVASCGQVSIILHVYTTVQAGGDGRQTGRKCGTVLGADVTLAVGAGVLSQFLNTRPISLSVKPGKVPKQQANVVVCKARAMSCQGHRVRLLCHCYTLLCWSPVDGAAAALALFISI